MTTVATYLVYVVLCVAVAIWVGRTLRRYGIIYLTEGHEEKRGLQEALSHLLMVGFYLVSFGVICFVLNSTGVFGSVSSCRLGRAGGVSQASHC